jgi:uncharacterized protein (DUF983 family)
MTNTPTQGTEGRPPLAKAALFGLCPECGARTLFAGPISFANRCTACGLDFSRFNVGDGPAALLIMLIGAIVVPLALWMHFAVHPPIVVHFILWPLLVLALTLGGLRVAKGGLIAAEHQREGREGRLIDAPDASDQAGDLRD